MSKDLSKPSNSNFVKDIPYRISSIQELKELNIREKALIENSKKNNHKSKSIRALSNSCEISRNTSNQTTPKVIKKINTIRGSNNNNIKYNEPTNAEIKLAKQNEKTSLAILSTNKPPLSIIKNHHRNEKSLSPIPNSRNKREINNCGSKFNNVSKFLIKRPQLKTSINDISNDSKSLSKVSISISNDQKACLFGLGDISQRNEVNTSTNLVTRNDHNSNTELSLIYKKRLISKNNSQKIGLIEKKIQPMLIRMEEFEIAKQNRLKTKKEKKAVEFLSQFQSGPKINENSKRLVKNNFYSRLEDFKQNSEFKKKILLEKHDEMNNRARTPKIESRSKQIQFSPLHYAKKQFKWEKDRQMKIESLREQEKIIEKKDCTFKPELNPKSLLIIQKKENNIVDRIYKNSISSKRKASYDDFDLINGCKKKNLKIDLNSDDSEDEKKDIIMEQIPKNTVLKKKNDNSRFNNYSTNKEEILIDNLFESRLNYLQQNHYDDKKINYI